ncbi:MAG TPA: SatD family protein [Solirubrobacterales bacterium]|nr:SatD family protein [Solirubrobacterales bacterium]
MAKAALYTLIGDVIESRRSANRVELQEHLKAALATVNGLYGTRKPLEATIGDEFQGCFMSAAEATGASLLLRLQLLGAGVDTRYGLGFGEVMVFTRRVPVTQDGPGWWAARDAIDACRELAEQPSSHYVRTYFFGGEDWPRERRGEEAALNSFLLCRDAMVDRMKRQTRNRLYGLLLGKSQAEIAAEEGTTQGAVSQSLSRSNAFAVLASQRQLEGLFQ